MRVCLGRRELEICTQSYALGVRNVAVAADAIADCNVYTLKDMSEVRGAFVFIHDLHETWAEADAGRRIGLEFILVPAFLGAHGLMVRRRVVLLRLHKMRVPGGRRSPSGGP